MSASTQSVGSLVVDIRANLAQLQSDMASVKDTIAKSSRQMSSQMRADMTETRDTLMLLRDDIGIGIPRELAKVIASSEAARTAISAISKAFIIGAFIGVALQAFDKIKNLLEKSAKHAEEEAKNTRDMAFAAQQALDATIKRAEQLDLIGKGEDERHAIQQKYFQDELRQNQARLAGLQAQIAAQIALMNLKIMAAGDEAGNAMTNTPINAQDAQNDARNKGLAALQKLMKDLQPQMDAARKAIDEALQGLKQDNVNYADYLNNLDLSRLKNWKDVEQNRVAITRDAIQQMEAAGQIGLDQELLALRTAATARHNIEMQSLTQSLNILNQDPSRNKEKIEAAQAQILMEEQNYQKELTDIYAHGVQRRKAENDAFVQSQVAAIKSMATVAQHLIPNGLFAGIGAGAKPGEGQTTADFMAASVERLASAYKDGAEAGKFLTEAMNAALTPEQQFELKSAEINAVWQQLKSNSPNGSVPADVISALHRELLLANPEFQKLKTASTEFGHDLSTELDNLVTKGESFHDFLLHIIDDLAQIILKATLLGPLEKFFSGGGSGVGGFVGVLGHLLGFAGGGNPPVGQVSLVGESGPELFVPQTAGTIIPNDKLGSFGRGGGSVVIQYLDARGADAGVEQRVNRAVQTAMQQAVGASVAATIELSRRT